MKIVITAMLCCGLALSLGACGREKEKESPKPPVKEETRLVEKPKPFESILPDTTLMYGEVDLSDETVAAVKKLGIWKIISSPKIEALLEDEIEEVREEMKEESGLTFEDLKVLLGGRVAIAVMSLEMPVIEAVNKAKVVTFVDAGAKADKLKEIVARFISTQLKADQAVKKTLTFKGIEYAKLEVNEETEPACVGFLPNGWGVICNDEESMNDLISRFLGEPRPSLAKEKTFKAMRARMDGGKAFLYVATAGMFDLYKDLDPDRKEMMDKWLKVWSLDKMEGGCLGLFIEGDALVARGFMPLADLKSGLAGLINAAEQPKRVLAAVPEDALGVFGFKVQPEQVYDTFLEILTGSDEEAPGRIEMMTNAFEKGAGLSVRKEILPAIGGEIALAVLKPAAKEGDSGSGDPTLVAVMSIKNRTVVEKLLNKTMPLSGAEANRKVEYDGFTILEDTIAYSDEFLIFSPDYVPFDMRRLIDVAAGKAKSIRNGDSFKNALSSLSDEPKGLVWLDVAAISAALKLDVQARELQRQELRKQVAPEEGASTVDPGSPEGGRKDGERMERDWRRRWAKTQLTALGTREEDEQKNAVLDLITKNVETIISAQLADNEGLLWEVVLK